jgi:hypothetical protein
MKKILLTSVFGLVAVGAANAALLPSGGVVGTNTFNTKIGDEQSLTTTSKVVVPAINELKGIIDALDLTGVEYTDNKTQDVAGSIAGGEGANAYTSAQAVADYVSGALEGIDVTGKQDKATGVTAGYVATWGAADAEGLSSTAGQVAITNTSAGITTGNTGLATGGAVADAITGLNIPELDPTCIDAGTGANNCILSQDMNGPGGTLQWVWLRMY